MFYKMKLNNLLSMLPMTLSTVGLPESFDFATCSNRVCLSKKNGGKGDTFEKKEYGK